MQIDRSTTAYLVFHYLILILLIFSVVVGFEQLGVDVSIWIGVVFAVLIGLLYPQVVKKLDVAPEQWQG